MGQDSQFFEAAATAADPDILRHELANLLHGLAGMTRLLKTSTAGADHERWCEAIQQAAEQACALLRHGGMSHSARVRRIDGLSLLEAIVGAHTPTATDKGLRLSLVTSAGLGRFWQVDAEILRQVLDNLLVNAVKFTDGGDVVLIARPGPGATLFLHVVDDGPGVPPGERRRIFDAGHRGRACTGRPGSGLGLALCRRNLELLGGRIRCGGLPAGGACFSVALPGVVEKLERSCRYPGALADVRCRIELEPPRDHLMRCVLESFGVDEYTSTRGAPRGLVVTISEARDPGGPEGPGMVMEAESPGVEPVYLPASLLPSRLRRGLLQLVLASRWSEVSRCVNQD